MNIPIFLSRPRPISQKQSEFLGKLSDQLASLGLYPKTLGMNEYGVDSPLSSVRMLMTESNGLLAVGLRRYKTDSLCHLKPDGTEEPAREQFLTSSWCQIEPAMAFQLGMPILILREKSVLPDGVFERGVTGLYLPECDIEGDVEDYLESAEWRALSNEFAARVRDYRLRRGRT